MAIVVRIIVAGVLLVAAGLKVYSAAAAPRIFFDSASERWWEMALVLGELSLGLWLNSRLWPRLSWAVAVFCFGTFAAVSFYKALSGETNCGCLGQIVVNPWYMAGFDVMVLAALFYFWPGDGTANASTTHSGAPSRKQIIGWAALWLALAVTSVYVMWPNIEPAPTETGIEAAEK